MHLNHDDRTLQITIKECFPLLEVAPEIREIKQVELFTKWRKLIPEIYQDETCPKPTEEIMKRIKKNKADKAKLKKSTTNSS